MHTKVDDAAPVTTDRPIPDGSGSSDPGDATCRTGEVRAEPGVGSVSRFGGLEHGPDIHWEQELTEPESGALFSPSGQHRYRLWRHWGDGCRGVAVFLMLNPSTADGHADDPTIRKCVGFAKHHGLHGIRVVNLFALRSTDPRSLVGGDYEHMVGFENDLHLRWVLRGHPAFEQHVIVAWGSTGGAGVARMVRRRRVDVRRMMREIGVQPMCLGTAKDGNPRHPLMLAYDTPLVPWEQP